MPDDLKSRLAKLGPERLADSMMELAQRSGDAHDLVERMTASPKSNVRRYKSKLAGLKRQTRFVDWREVRPFVGDLQNMFEDLRAADVEPEAGVELVAEFFRCDATVFEHCDDSSGSVGDVFRFNARDLFVHYAARYQDKPALMDLLTELLQKDDYGIRDVLVDAAVEYLPPESLRGLAERFRALADRTTDTADARHWLLQIESLAKQLKDARMFENAREKRAPEFSYDTFVEIARIHLDAGDPKAALDWLTRVAGKESGYVVDRDELLLAAHRALGNQKESETVAWRIFRGYRTAETLDALLSIIGSDKRVEVVAGEVQKILGDSDFSCTSGAFLLACGAVDEAERYVIDRRDKLDGEFYASLLPIAEALESGGRPLAASVIDRALLDSILQRAISKYYHHGVRYLKKLDTLNKKITAWRRVSTHAAYLGQLKETHARKSSFWQRYNGRGRGE